MGDRTSCATMDEDVCRICYAAISKTDRAALVGCEQAVCQGPADWAWSAEDVEECPQLHRSCLSKYLIIQAEDGRFPGTCPFCLRPLSIREVHENLSPRSCRAWLRLHRLWLELRELREFDTNPQELQELNEARMMQDLGCRRCPACGVWIQKQEPGWLTGCDKMTCRCGGNVS